MAEKKLISWNVNGIRACIGKGFSEAFAALDADILCLQETKVQAGQVDFAPEGYHCYWNYAEKKGYSGTAVFSREEPLSVSYGIGIPEHDREGRVITLGFEKFYFVCVYTPNSQDGLARLDYRMTWEDAFRDYLLSLDRDKPVIVCGDMNVAHNEIDLKNPKTNRKNPGFTDEERSKMTELLSAGFIDTFRYFYPDVEGQYSWLAHRLFPLLRAAQQPAYRRENTSGDIRLRPLSCRADCRYIKKRRRKGDAGKLDFILSFR